ncbi:hypothetical protein FACS189451_04510 [Bacteroidia bacterium]|nr:hypothetical protein FACS189451_04510 [Bacteroidia bacterium]
MQVKMEKISPIKERILYFIERHGVAKTHFCEKTDISYANLKGKGLCSEFGGGQIGKILSTYPEISAEWLLTGNGPMLKEEDVTADNQENEGGEFRDEEDFDGKSILSEIVTPKDLYSIIREKERALTDKDQSLKRVIRNSFNRNKDSHQIIKEKDAQIKILQDQILSMSRQITDLSRHISEFFKEKK